MPEKKKKKTQWLYQYLGCMNTTTGNADGKAACYGVNHISLLLVELLFLLNLLNFCEVVIKCHFDL